MKNILVTGGAGFIGSNFIRYLLAIEKDVRIFNLDALTYAGSEANLIDLPDPDRHTLIVGDICDRELIDHTLAERQIEMIVHFAAETHVDRSIHDPGSFVRTNINGTYTLLEAARQCWLVNKSLGDKPARFHHISTDEVFGTLNLTDPAWTEETPYMPSSPYSASKASSDHLVRAYGHTYGLPYTITNCSNNYGPHQFPEKLIPLMIMNALAGKPLPVYGDGGQIRDWLYVEDHCEAIWLVASKAQNGKTYNIGGGTQPKNIEVVNHLCAALDELIPNSKYAPHKNLIRFVEDRPGHDRRYAMDIASIYNDLGWSPRHTLGSGLKQTVEWYVSHPEWMETIRKKADYKTWMEKNYEGRKK